METGILPNVLAVCVCVSSYRPETDITASLHDQVDKLEKHLRYINTLTHLQAALPSLFLSRRLRDQVTVEFSKQQPVSGSDIRIAAFFPSRCFMVLIECLWFLGYWATFILPQFHD